jgi:hypothetical protein
LFPFAANMICTRRVQMCLILSLSCHTISLLLTSISQERLNGRQ